MISKTADIRIDERILRITGIKYKKGLKRDDHGHCTSVLSYTNLAGEEVEKYYDRDTGASNWHWDTDIIAGVMNTQSFNVATGEGMEQFKR